MPNSVIRTKTIFLFGAYPEYLQKKVIKEMRKRKYTVKQPWMVWNWMATISLLWM